MKKIFALIIFTTGMFCAAAQTQAYKGGVADGHSLTEQVAPLGNAAIFQPYFGGIGDGHANDSLINAAQYAAINMQSPFKGSLADGYAVDSLITFSPATPALLFAPYRGSLADGYAGDSVITFAQYAPINMFSAYLGAIGDGYDIDSVITFNQHGYITMYQPYAGGQADGWAGYPIFGVTVVPVNLLSFTGEQADKKHLLKWTTSQEINSSYFDVERSADARHFTSIGRVAAAGTSSIEKRYNLTDAAPMQGNNYYRLKQVDNDGSFVYSNIILLKMLGNSGTISVYPNPTTKTLTVLLGGLNDNSMVNAGVYDMTGRYLQGMTLKKNNASFNFDVERLPAGIYNLRLEWKGEVTVWRFIKQ
jgi:hypothetical protein